MPSTTTAEEKAALRGRMSRYAAQLTEEERHRSDDALLARFLALPQVECARRVLLFAGMGTEPDTLRLVPALLARGKQVALPRCLPGHRMEARLWDGSRPLVPHRYGMLEPDEGCPLLSPGELDLILVPALCYDRSCRRLGRGGGFYDRYLAQCSAFTVGLCRQALVQDHVPTEEHDRPVSCVVTESTTYEARPPEGGPASDSLKNK